MHPETLDKLAIASCRTGKGAKSLGQPTDEEGGKRNRANRMNTTQPLLP